MKNRAVKSMLEVQYSDADKIEVEFLCRVADRYIFECTVYFDDTDSYFVEIVEITNTKIREESSF